MARWHNRMLLAGLLAGLGLPAMGQQGTVALQEMATLAQQLDVCVLDTTYYVSLENLNDVSGTATNQYDSIQDQGGPFVMIPDMGVFLPRKNLATAVNPWRGPYVAFQQGRTQLGTTPYDQGSPLDPWGQPYYLFNPYGLLRGDTGMITLELYGDQFDRYTIVSLGPDGVKSSDDLAYQFGGGVTGTRLTSLRGGGVVRTSPDQVASPTYSVAAGTSVTLRGTNFGSTQAPGRQVVFGSTPVTEVLGWTNREITVAVPQALTGTDNFKVQLGPSQFTNGIQATITGGNTGVEGWEDY